MVAGKAKNKVVADRLDWVSRMVGDIRSLPLESLEVFLSDKRNVWTAESCLRRALEALLDLGRHLLAKVHAVAVTEYKQVADELKHRGILDEPAARKLRVLAGYRNRLVHFYHEVTPEELYRICTRDIDDILSVRDAFARWVQTHPDSIDETI